MSRDTQITFFQDRIAAIVREAAEEGLSVLDVIPPEAQDHFRVELEKTKSQFVAVEKKLQDACEKYQDLEAQLESAQQALANVNVSDDREQLKTDLDLANKASDFYRGLKDEAEERSAKYAQKWKEALQKQAAAEEVDRHIERLDRENHDLKLSASRLTAEITNMQSNYDKVRDQDLATIVDKEEKIMALEKELKELKSKSEELVEENSAVEGQYHEVMSSLDAVVVETTQHLNAAKARARSAEQQQSATFSEIQPLLKFFAHANGILDTYQGIFKQLLNATESDVEYSAGFRETLSARLSASRSEYEAFHTLRAIFTSDGGLLTQHSEQLSILARSAENMQKSLDGIGEDVVQFLKTLERRPDIRKLIHLKFKVLR